MNHVPDEVRAALDELGNGLIADDPTTVGKRLRCDIRLQIARDQASPTDGVHAE